jgi:hypothetical protein
MRKHAIDWFEIPAADFQRGAMFPVANPAEAVGGTLTGLVDRGP